MRSAEGFGEFFAATLASQSASRCVTSGQSASNACCCAVWPSASFLGALLVVIGALVLAIALLISKALSGVFGVALYRYALDGEAVGGFTQDELESAVKRKGGRNAPPTATPGTV